MTTTTGLVARERVTTTTGLVTPAVPVLPRTRRRIWTEAGTVRLLFALVAAADFAFGMWMSSRGFRWGDAYSRSVSALLALYSTDPHLAAIGFIWMPLPTLLQLPWMAFYPLWQGMISTGFALSMTTALAGGVTAVIIYRTGRRMGIAKGIALAYTGLVVLNPMLFLFAGNGESEGVAAPGFVGAVCALLLFWRTGQRLYVMWAGIGLAWAFACVYEAGVIGAVLLVVLIAGILLGSREVTRANPQGPWRAVQGLSTVFMFPSLCVGVTWVISNAVIFGDPLYFAHAQYSDGVQNKALAAAGSAGAYQDKGELLASLQFAAERTWPFLIPIAGILIVRLLDRRLLRFQVLAVAALACCVPFGLMVYVIFRGETIGYLRYFMYPLFVGPGWGVYEIAVSSRRTRTTFLMLAMWVAAIPATLWVMYQPSLGRELESATLHGLLTGGSGNEIANTRGRRAQGNPEGFINVLSDNAPLARYLEAGPLKRGKVLADSVAAWPIAAEISPSELRNRLILSPDRRFKSIVLNMWGQHIAYVVVPDPALVPSDEVDRVYPRLWADKQPGFRQVRYLPNTFDKWRVFQVVRPGTPPSVARVSSDRTMQAAAPTSFFSSARVPADLLGRHA